MLSLLIISRFNSRNFRTMASFDFFRDEMIVVSVSSSCNVFNAAAADTAESEVEYSKDLVLEIDHA